MTATTIKTEFKPYEGMRLEHTALVAQEGAVVIGSGEKVWEHTKERSHEFVGEKRPRWRLRGYVTKRFFAADEVVVHISEVGHIRPSTTVQQLKVNRSGQLMGYWWSTAANSYGSVTWRRADDPTGRMPNEEG